MNGPSLSTRRPFPGQGGPQGTNSKKPIVRERPSPGSSSARPQITNRSIKPEWIEPSPLLMQKQATSPPSKKLGTPEDLPSESQSLPSVARHRPSPERFNPDSADSNFGRKLERSRPPSPGMGSNLSKRPPSPGLGSGTRVPPSPGRNSPAPPSSRVDHYTQNLDDDKSETDSIKSPARQKSVRFDESPPQERFIFSSNPSENESQPSHLHVSSSTTSMRLPAPKANSDSRPNLEIVSDAVEPVPEPKFSPSKNKKNDNPLRNNPHFLQKMAEAAESDSDDDDDDDELKIYNSSARNLNSSQNKLTGMAKMKKLAELSSMKDMNSLPLNKSVSYNDDDKNDNDDDDDDDLKQPVTFLDGPRLKTVSKSKSKDIEENHKLTGTVENIAKSKNSNFANAPKHWSKVNPSSPSRRQILEGIKSSPTKQSSSTTSMQEHQISPALASPSSVNSSRSPSVTTPSASSPEKSVKDPPNHFTEATNSTSLPAKKTQTASPTEKSLKDSSSLSTEEKTSTSSPGKKTLSTSMTEKSLKDSSSLSTQEKTSTVEKEEISNVTKLSGDSSKQMTISEKMEKRKLSKVPVRQLSNSSAASTGSKSATSANKTRRELLDKVKGRMSRSPSPSPLMRHMVAPKVTVQHERKTAMQKLIEARQKNSRKHFENKNGASKDSTKIHSISLKGRSTGTSNSPQPLKSVSSIVSAPSDEKAVSVSITNSASSEHLSVQKGLYLVLQQNEEAKKLHQPKNLVEEKDSRGKDKKSINQLPEIATRSQESSVEPFKVDQRTNNVNEGEVKCVLSEDKEEHTLTNLRTNHQDDDDFSIDDYPEELSPSPSPSGKSRLSNGQSKWAEVMEDRLRRSNGRSTYLGSEDNYDRGSWSSDDDRKKKDKRRNRKMNVLHKTESFQQKRTSFNQKINSFPSRDELIQLNASMSNSFLSKERKSSRNENVFKGAYAELLPRSTNPLLVRTYKPTLPSSLMSTPKWHLHVSEAEAPDVWHMSLDTQLQETKEVTNNSNVREHNIDDTHESHSSNNDQFKDSLKAEKTSDVSEKETKNKSVDDVQQPPQGEDSSYLQGSIVESTLIGQFHVDSDDFESDACIQNQSIAEWWDKSYAHTQDDEVNSDIKQALSNSRDSVSLAEMQKNAGDESDDDVFYGLDDGSPSSKARTGNSSKRKDEMGFSNLDPIPSQDDSDFEMIMNGNVTPSPKHKKDELSSPSSPHSTSMEESFKNNRANKGTESKEISKGIVVEKKKTDSPVKMSEVHKSDTNQHTKHPKSNQNQRKISKAHRSRRGNKTKNLDDLSVQDASVDEGTSRDESDDDSGTYDDTHDGNISVSSKSSTSEGSYTMGSDTLESMSLSERERRKWIDWDKKDHDTAFSGDTEGQGAMGTDQLAVMERRARSHESLLMHAYTALSKPAPKKMVEKGPVQHPQLAASGSSQYYSDAENQLPSKGAEPTDVYRKYRLEMDRFLVKLKNVPFEVLKLNREKRWQTRFITVSKEGAWLKNAIDNGDTLFFPLALLWVKKLTKQNEYSVTTIDKQGRGGMILAHMSRAKIENEWSSQFPLTKKQAEKFKDSVIVRIYSQTAQKSSAITLKCTEAVANQIINGCSAVVNVLRRQHLSKGKSASNALISDVNRKGVSAANSNPIQRGNDARPQNGASFQKQIRYDNQHNISSNPHERMLNQSVQGQVVVAKNYESSGAPNLWEA